MLYVEGIKYVYIYTFELIFEEKKQSAQQY